MALDVMSLVFFVLPAVIAVASLVLNKPGWLTWAVVLVTVGLAIAAVM